MTSNIPSLMATMKHRKLFPAENETNQTDCYEFCDPPCSYNCYPFTDFYYPPPPPSPPLSAVDHNDQSQNISPYIIILLSLIATSLLIVGYYIVIAKSCAGFCRRNNNNEHDEPSQSDTIDEDFIDENHVDHPIWFITTVGLHQSIINAITVCKYKKGEGLIEGTECSVCLNEFQEDETLRLLPKCNHAFHIPCIDTWLRSHTNCPLCRAIIVTDSLSSNMARPPTLSSSDQNGEALVVNEETQMGIINSENDIQLGENRIRAVTEINEGDQILQIDDDHGIISKEAVNSQEDEIQPVRSSVSMDSYSSSIIYEVEDLCSAECEENSIIQSENDERYNLEMAQSKDDEDGNSDTIRLIRRASKDQCLHLSPVSMKRSFSCGGRFLPTKHHRSFNSVLPL